MMPAKRAIAPLDLPKTLELLGPCPSKKNEWRPGKGGRIIFAGRKRADGTRRDVKGEYKELIAQAAILWGQRRPCVHPVIQIQFFVRDRASDTDNKFSTILDALVAAGVFENDNIAQFNGTKTILPAIVGAVEKTVIRIVKEDSEGNA